MITDNTPTRQERSKPLSKVVPELDGAGGRKLLALSANPCAKQCPCIIRVL